MRYWVVAPPATSRHTNPPLWLLPSRPDQVHGLSLREDQWSHHNVTIKVVSNETGGQYNSLFDRCKPDCRRDLKLMVPTIKDG